MKASRQFKHVNVGFGISNHTFINKIAAGIQQKLQQEVPGLALRMGGKSENGTKIKIMLTGSIATADADQHEEVVTKVRQTIDDLKNPSDLLSLVK